MTTYILTLISASLAIALISILAPEGSGGIAKHVRLCSSLVLICVLIAPLSKFTEGLKNLANGSFTLPNIELTDQESAEKQMQSALDNASKSYFLETLEQLIAKEFSIKMGDIRCTAKWTDAAEEVSPKCITVLLSGSAIWKNPSAIETYVTDLLGCECITAIE